MHQHHALRTIFEGTQYYHLGIYLSHRVAIVTDGDHGVGLQTAHELALRGAHVYLTCRRRESGERACEEVQQRSRNRNVFARVLDMGSLMSVRQFVTSFLAEQQHLNILVNNAEVFMADPQTHTADGHELHLGINHLAPFLLTNLLLDTMRSSPESTRIINVSSSLHGWADWRRTARKPAAKLAASDLLFTTGTRPYTRLEAYAQSKLATNLFTRHLATRLLDEKTTVNAVHPGFVRSEAMRRCMGTVGYWLVWYFLKTEHSGAQTTLCVALDPRFKTESGRYLSDCQVVDDGRLSEASRDAELATWLWQESERLVELDEAVALRTESTQC